MARSMCKHWAICFGLLLAVTLLVACGGPASVATPPPAATPTLRATDAAAPSPTAPATTGPRDQSPEAFLAWAYAERARAMAANDPQALDALYGANAPLLAHERDRLAFMSGLGPRWNGTILSYDASAEVIDLQVSGTTATGRVYETLHIRWTPGPASPTPGGPGSGIDSYMGIRHEVTLERGAQGWRIVRDSYEETELFGASPDLVPGSWSAVRAGSAMPSAAPAPRSTSDVGGWRTYEDTGQRYRLRYPAGTAIATDQFGQTTFTLTENQTIYTVRVGKREAPVGTDGRVIRPAQFLATISQNPGLFDMSEVQEFTINGIPAALVAYSYSDPKQEPCTTQRSQQAHLIAGKQLYMLTFKVSGSGQCDATAVPWFEEMLYSFESTAAPVPSARPATSPTSTPTAAACLCPPASATGDWECHEHTDGGGGLRARSCAPAPLAEAEWLCYENLDYGFALEYPAGLGYSSRLRLDKPKDPTGQVASYEFFGAPGSFWVDIWLTSEPDLPAWFAKQDSILIGRRSPLTEANATVGGCAAVVFAEDNQGAPDTFTVFLRHGAHIYRLQFRIAWPYGKGLPCEALPTVRRVLDSIRFSPEPVPAEIPDDVWQQALRIEARCRGSNP